MHHNPFTNTALRFSRMGFTGVFVWVRMRTGVSMCVVDDVRGLTQDRQQLSNISSLMQDH